MRIAHITTYPSQGARHIYAGGVASYAKNLISLMSISQNHDIYVLCNRLNGLDEEYSEDGIKVVRCFDRNLRYIKQLYGKIKQIKPEMVHIQQELNLFGSVFTAYMLQWFVAWIKKEKIRVIVTVHGVVPLEKVDKNFVYANNSSLPACLVRIALKVIYKPLCVKADKIIVHEEFFKNILIVQYGISAGKISVIPHGIEEFKILTKPEACERLSLDAKRNICLFLGYATGYKGLELLIDGFSEYAKEDPQALLLIAAGKHPKLINNKKYLKSYEKWQQRAEEKISAEQYSWVGFVQEDQLVSYYSACDVVLFPYTFNISSSGPMAMALGCEKPFLLSDVFENVISDKSIIFSKNADSLKERLKDFFMKKISVDPYYKNFKIMNNWRSISEKHKIIYEIC